MPDNEGNQTQKGFEIMSKAYARNQDSERSCLAPWKRVYDYGVRAMLGQAAAKFAIQRIEEKLSVLCEPQTSPWLKLWLAGTSGVRSSGASHTLRLSYLQSTQSRSAHFYGPSGSRNSSTTPSIPRLAHHAGADWNQHQAVYCNRRDIEAQYETSSYLTRTSTTSYRALGPGRL